MSSRKPISTDRQVAGLKADSSKYAVRIKDQPGLYLRVTPTGAKSFAAVARDPGGRQTWATLGGVELTVAQAVREINSCKCFLA